MSSLLFEMSLPVAATNKRLQGILKLRDDNGGLINTYQATSATVGKQYWKSWNFSKHLIPPGDKYTVDLEPSRSSLDGIKGSFYAINPYSVPTDGDTRAAFGIHNDANRAYAWGSWGCIVPITERGWAAYERDIADLIGEGSTLPLEVKYVLI